MMMETSRADDLAGGLATGDKNARLKSLRAIKNSVIGSKREKTKHLLYLPTILEILSTDQDAEVLIQAAQAIGSFAAAPDGAKAVIDQGGVPKLLIALKHPDIRVIEASARALKLLYTKTTDISPVEVQQVLQTPGATTALVALLSSPTSPSIGESAAWIIAKCCEIDEQDAKVAFYNAGVLQPLVQLLQDSTHRNRQAAALTAITALTHNDLTACRNLLQHPMLVIDLLQCVKSSLETPRMRFTACVCLTNLLPALQSRFDSNSFLAVVGNGTSGTSVLPTREEVQDTVLPVLIRLLNEDTAHSSHHSLHPEKTSLTNKHKNSGSSGNITSILVRPPLSTTATSTMTATKALPPQKTTKNSVAAEVPGVLLNLLADNPSLQAAAIDADAILRLANLLRSPNTNNSGKMHSLLVLGMLTETVEHHRRKLVDSGALPAVAAALTDPDLSVRGAACCCMRSLSRSTRLLRCSLGSLSDIAAPLLELSRMTESEISNLAAATLANMAIEYSSIKDELLVLQGITRFVEMTEVEHNKKLQLYGVWGLSSVVYLSTDEVKSTVMKALPWSTVVEFLHGDDQDIKEKTLLLLRNLAHRGGGRGAGGATAATSSPPSTVLVWSQGQFLSTLLEALKTILASPAPPFPTVLSSLNKQFENALYCLVNIASGQQLDKDAVANLVLADLRPAFEAALAHPEESIREGGVWVIINLTYVQDSSFNSGEEEDGDGGVGGLEKRRQDLISMGIAEKLRVMKNEDSSMRVRERADTAWVQLLGGRRILIEEEEEEEGGEGGGGGGLSMEEIEQEVALGRLRGLRARNAMTGVIRIHDDEDAMDEDEDDFMDEEEEEEDPNAEDRFPHW
jgi:hypothetical protein